MRERPPWRTLLLAAVASLAMSPAWADEEAWDQIRSTLFPGRAILAEGDTVRLFGPKRADDAALVPVTVYLSESDIRRVKRLTLVVDQNPAPVVAELEFGEAYRTGAAVGDRTIEARLRLEQMSRVRAILETDDGTLHEASQFIAGSGGCTSTSLKDMDEAMSRLGEIKLRTASDVTRGPEWSELQIQVRHPNFSGLQIDTRTNTFAKPLFVDRLDVDLAGIRLVTIKSGIAISEDPTFRMSFARRDGARIAVTAHDTDGRRFRAETE